MPTKLKANGQSICTINNDRLREIFAKGGKQGHKARMELIRRGQLDGQGKDVFELIVDSAKDPKPRSGVEANTAGGSASA